VVDVVSNLKEYGLSVTIHDPLASPQEVHHEYGLTTTKKIPQEKFDAIVLAVCHQEFEGMELNHLLQPKGVVYDVKGVLGKQATKKL
jgi:UDP-N-acetyl-D-galactosamine dehydrogenase